MFRTGYVIDQRADWVWFVGLPFVAVAIGLASQRWLSAVAVASFSLWVTAPHHFATWLRAYGIAEDRKRLAEPLVVGPIAIGLLVLTGLVWAPLALLLVVWAWDHQHSIMQQYGFARIYDHKARSGAPSTASLDLGLNWILYANLMIVSPLYSDFWIRELIRFGVDVDIEAVRVVQQVSATATIACLIAYAGHTVWCLRRGYEVNPIKLLFIGSSYFLWYSTAWWVQSILVARISHSLMHGVQYIVMVHAFLRRKVRARGAFIEWLVRPGHVAGFLVVCLAYAVLYQLVTLQPLSSFGFGALDFGERQAAPIASLGAAASSARSVDELYVALVLNFVPLLHYYVDSFIWRVSDARVQEGL
jgi:hypothetical protein